MTERTYKITLGFFYLLGFSVVVYTVLNFFEYYSLPIVERPHSALHFSAKPGGRWGHGMGITGSAMILLLFLYSLRKRNFFSYGTLSHWLGIHIMLGILGPVFVTLHTAFKFGGVVAVSYFSMVAVMVSGVFGRYLYLQIPRAISGGELSREEIAEKRMAMAQLLREQYGLDERQLEEMESVLKVPDSETKSVIRILFSTILCDLLRATRKRTLKKLVGNSMIDRSARDVHRATGIITSRALLVRKALLLDVFQQIFYYWHLIHKPFAFVMILIMILHVMIVTLLGYRWIF